MVHMFACSTRTAVDLLVLITTIITRFCHLKIYDRIPALRSLSELWKCCLHRSTVFTVYIVSNELLIDDDSVCYHSFERYSHVLYALLLVDRIEMNTVYYSWAYLSVVSVF